MSTIIDTSDYTIEDEDAYVALQVLIADGEEIAWELHCRRLPEPALNIDFDDLPF